MGTPRDAEDRVKGLGEGADGHVQSEGCDTLKQGSGLFWEAGQGAGVYLGRSRMAGFRHEQGNSSVTYCIHHFFFFIKSGRSPEWVGYLETLRKPALLFVLVIYFILAERG